MGAGGAEGPRDGSADAAAGPGDERGLAGEIEHCGFLHSALAKASRSAGPLRLTAATSGTMRLTMPARTFPAPASAKEVTSPSPASHSTLSRQRTRPVT